MLDTDNAAHSRMLPTTFHPRYPVIVYLGMVMLTGLGALPIWAEWMRYTRSLDRLGAEAEMMITPILAGLFLLVFPALLLWSVLTGRPRLDLGQGWLRHTSLYGRVTVIDLETHAKAVLDEEVLARGYQPRLDFWPADPDNAKVAAPRRIPLRPFVRNRQEAEAILALVHAAGGSRPDLSPKQAQTAITKTRRDIQIALGIVAVCFLLLIAMNRDRL